MKIILTSFGRKYGQIEADIVLDVRCLENPFWVSELKEKSGLDAEVRDYIFNNPKSAEYLRTLLQLMRLQAQLACERSCQELRIAVGCTGGRHRSVAVAEFLTKELSEHEVEVIHRDIGKG